MKSHFLTIRSVALLLLAPFASTAFALTANENVTINAKWQDENAKDYKMNGVKITIKDQLATGGAADITGFLIGGAFTFRAPRNGYVYDVVLSASFPGVDANGNAVAGGGTGAFTLQDPNTSQTLTEAAGSNIVNFTSVKGGTATLQSGDVWAAFHGMAEMVREARRRLALNKDAFTVLFPFATISSYSPTTKNVRINLLDRYDWDVVAHEFGHAIADQTSSVNSYAGGKHSGSNQYSYSPNAGTLGDKMKSLNLAFNEAFGTWIGGSLLERSDFKGAYPRVGDGKYTDTEDSTIDNSYEDNTTQTYFGDDTENAGFQLLFDLEDTSNEANKRTTKISGLRDRTALGLLGVWNILKGSAVENISDFWKVGFLPSKSVAGFLPGVGNTVNDTAALEKAMNAAETFAEFGVAPLLFKPGRGEKIELNPATPPATNAKFEWSQEATKTSGGALQAGVAADLKLNKFDLVLYSSDLKTELFHKPDLTGNTYTLTDADLSAIKVQVERLKTAGTPIASVKAVLTAKSDVKTPETGPYLSNGVELLLQDFNRAVVAVVDSSGSNTSTDPTNQRVVASQQSISNLVSQADAALDATKVPDIAAAIDFDSSVTVLSQFADPDAVSGTLNAIDASGGTSIDGGLNAAIKLLDSIQREQTAGSMIAGIFTDRASILLFTDGQNNSGDGPVIAAIAAATAKGYRVHYGFLNPFFTPKPSTENWAPEPGATMAPAASAAAPPPPARVTLAAPPPPATIQQAVIESGGVFGIISDAASQFAFVQQVFSRGLSNADEDNAPGGKLVGQTQTTEQLTPAIFESAFEFSGTKDEQSRVVVETKDFRAAVTIYDRDGVILAFLIDTDGDGRVEIPLKLPYTGKYALQVYSDDGKGGYFSVFVDVENARFTYTRVGVESELYERLASNESDFAAEFAGKYVGIVEADSGSSKGSLTLKIGKSGAFSGKVVINGVKVAVKGQFDPVGAFTGVIASKLGDLTFDLKLASTALGRKVQGTVAGASFASAIDADMRIFKRTSNPAGVAGYYTFVIPSESDPAVPGDGFGALKIKANGSVRVAGALGDNTKISLGTALSPEFTFPVNLPAYRKGGGIFGQIAVRDTPSGHLDGNLDWSKPANGSDALYPAGFAGSVPLVGSRYVKPAANQRVLALAEIPAGNLHLSFGAGGLVPNPGEHFLFVNTRNKATLTGPDPLEKVALRFKASSGLFSGKLPVYISGAPARVKFGGVVLQAQNRGSGHFLGNGQAGFAFIEPYDGTALRIISPATAEGTVGTFFSYLIEGVNGVISFDASGLPSWLILNEFNGTIRGTPPQAGVFFVTVSVTDNTERTASQNLKITIK